MRARLLAGLNVLEVGGSVAAAFCAKCLADLGAEVSVVEPPQAESGTQRPAPCCQALPEPERSVVRSWLRSGKQSITLDLERVQDRSVFRKRVNEADILIESLGQAALAERGLAHDDLRGGNRNLTIVSITPFGKGGAYAGYQADDLVLFAMSGFAHYLVCPVDDPGCTPPKQNPGYQVSLVTGLIATNAALWAIMAGRRKGEGITVDVSEWEAFAHLMYEQTAYYSDGVLRVGRQRGAGEGTAVAGGLIWCLPCSDGWVIISPREDHQFKRWCEVMGDPEWTLREEFATAKGREQRSGEIHERSAEWTRQHTKREVFLAAQERKVPCFPVSLVSDLAEVEQLQHRGFFEEIEHSAIKGLKYPGLPFKADAGS